MKVTRLFNRIAQKHPGGDPGRWFHSEDKFKYWGMEPTNYPENYDYNTHQMGRNTNLTRIDSCHVATVYNEESSKATGMGDLSHDTRDSEGMGYSRVCTASAFEDYFVAVETTLTPKNQTTDRLRYE